MATTMNSTIRMPAMAFRRRCTLSILSHSLRNASSSSCLMFTVNVILGWIVSHGLYHMANDIVNTVHRAVRSTLIMLRLARTGRELRTRNRNFTVLARRPHARLRALLLLHRRQPSCLHKSHTHSPLHTFLTRRQIPAIASLGST